MMSPSRRYCLNTTIKAIFLLSVVVAGQQQDPYGDYPDYNDYAGDYGQDNLYSDYAEHKDGGYVLSRSTFVLSPSTGKNFLQVFFTSCFCFHLAHFFDMYHVAVVASTYTLMNERTAWTALEVAVGVESA